MFTSLQPLQFRPMEARFHGDPISIILGENQSRLRQGFGCAKTLGRAKGAARVCSRAAGPMQRISLQPSSSSSHRAATASEGMRQSPLGERLTEPTLGPSGRQERLNCWAKKRR